MRKTLVILSLLLAILVLSTAGAEFSTPSSCGRTACHMLRDAQANGDSPACYINSAKDLKLKVFRLGTALAIEIYINEWLEQNPGITIYHIQHLHALGSGIVYIWYKP